MISTDIQQQISELVEQKFSELALPGQPQSLYDPVRYTLSLGGKRIRPYFTLAGCGLCNGTIEDAMPAAIAIELLHNFTLLHDDIMDCASTRRGQPSVFKKWNASTAILSGDAMYAWAFEQLQFYGYSNSFSKKQYSSILDIFLDSAKTVCEGQAYDLNFENEHTVKLDSYTHMIRGKTAALITGAFKMGGVVADASEEQLKKLEMLGNHAGIGFQIQDDLLDVIADPAKFGKRMGGDIFEGKKTYLSILSLQRGNEHEKEQLHHVFTKDDVNEGEVKMVIDLYRQLGVIESAQSIIKEHYNKAIEQIEMFNENRYQADLKKFIINLKNREY